MLPSRGLASNPASALRYSLSSRTKPTRISSTRQFSYAQPRSSALSRHSLTTPGHGRITPSASAAGYGIPVGMASGVFAQRSGAARNLSLWPFQSKPRTVESTVAPTEFSTPEPTETQPHIVETSTVEPVSSAGVSPTNESDLSQLPDDFLSGFDSQSLLDIPERLGYLKELGLDFGWGPTTCSQWLLEHIHVLSGLPWWGSIAATAILFRAVMFVPTLWGSKHQARLQKLQATPAYVKAKAEFEEAAFRSRDQSAQLAARSEMRRLTKGADVSLVAPFVGLAAVPFSFGMFRLIRGMAGIPVPGMETGGLAWFSDLTVHDPLYILPCTSIIMGVLMFKQTQRANLNPSPAQQAMMKGMTYVLPPVLFLGTAWLPAGLQWFFLTLSTGSVVQTFATLNPAVRRWAGLPTLPDRSHLAPQGIVYQSPSKPGIRDSLQEGMAAASKSLKEVTGATDEKARWKKAQEYEEHRALEDLQRAERRMEEVRRRRAERRL